MVRAYVEGRHEVQTGIYTFFEMVVKNAVAEGQRGIVAMPIKAEWGPAKKFVELPDYPSAKEVFGTGQTAKLLQLAFWGNPVSVKAYRLATKDAKKAELTLDSIKITALYEGTRANGFQVTIRPYLADPTRKEFLLTEGPILLESYVFTDADELVEKANDSYFIRIEKTADDTPEDVNGQALAGGNSGEGVTTLEYAEFLKAAEAEEFNWIVNDGVKDAAIKQMFIQFTKDYRPAGKLVKTAVGGLDALDIDYYAVTNVPQWGEKDGIRYTPEEVAIYVAAAAAACPLNESLAAKVTPFDRVQKLSIPDTNKMIKEGNLILYQDGQVVRFNTPVNTCTSLKNFDSLIKMGDDADEDAVIRTVGKIKIIEAFDYIAEAEEMIFKRFISKPNSNARRLAVAQMIKEDLLEPLEVEEVLERGTTDCYPDTRYHGVKPSRNAYKDEAYFITEFLVLDAAEKIYNVNKAR